MPVSQLEGPGDSIVLRLDISSQIPSHGNVFVTLVETIVQTIFLAQCPTRGNDKQVQKCFVDLCHPTQATEIVKL